MKQLRWPAIAIIVGVLVLYGLGRWDAHMSARQGEYVTAARAALAEHHGWQKQQDHLRAVANHQAMRARADSAARAVATAQLLALQGHLVGDTSLRDSVNTLLQERAYWTHRDSTWAADFALMLAARSADSLRADQAEARVAQLEALTQQGIAVAECHVLGAAFLPRCPSRTVSYVAGAITTLVVVIAKP